MMDVPALALKYAMRRLVQFNPYAIAQADASRQRERLSDTERAPRIDRLLRATLESAARRIPAYRWLNGRIPHNDLPRFVAEHVPIVAKADLQHGRTQYFPNGGEHRPWWGIGKTSGTSGSPLVTFRSVKSIALEQATLLQHWRWAGFNVNDRQVVLRGDLIAAPDRRTPPYWFHDRAGRSMIFSTRHLNRQNFPVIADAMAAFGARWLRCYPSAGHELARFASEQNRTLRFDGVITGSEPVYPIQRECIQRTFGARLYAGYGMAERVAYAAECEHGQLHANLDYSHVEIVDKEGRPTDGVGYLVGTTFHNHVMPLLRYRLDDTARWERNACACGRTYPVLVDIEGRVGDQLFDLDGNPVNATVITFVFKEARDVLRAQVAQVAHDRWEVRVVPDSDYDDTVGAKLVADFQRLISPRLNISVKRVRQIDSLASGKFKWVSQEWRVDDVVEH